MNLALIHNKKRPVPSPASGRGVGVRVFVGMNPPSCQLHAPSLAWRVQACTPVPLSRRAACRTNSLLRPQPLSRLRERGVAAVEFAIVLVFLLLVLAGVVEFGR